MVLDDITYPSIGMNSGEGWGHTTFSSHFPFRQSVACFIDYCEGAAPSKALYDGILSLPLSDLTIWHHLQDDDMYFLGFVASLLSYLQTLVGHHGSNPMTASFIFSIGIKSIIQSLYPIGG